MRKVWVYKRKSVKGWWVGWYESGKRKAKALPSKALAEHFRQIKYTQLNSDVFTGTVSVGWAQMVQEYRRDKQVAGLVESSLYEQALTLGHFERLVGECSSKHITQHTIDTFILDRSKEVKRSTLNKDISNLKAFVNWCRANRYLNGDIKLKLLKEDERPVKSLSTTQIKQLLSASKPFPRLRMRILLALGTGLRRGDIDAWKVSDLDFERGYVTTRSTKTRKSMGSRPLPVPIVAELTKYVLRDFKFHDLRKTFGSVLAQHGVSTAVVQRLLEHSSSDLTNKVYVNVDPVLRRAVDQMPVVDWL
jgi:integrase